VDSTPPRHRPPSMIRSTSVPKSAATWEARVGLMRPDKFALGINNGALQPPAINGSDHGVSGQRTAIVESQPPAWWHRAFSLRGKTSVKGPGQKASIRLCASGPIWAKSAQHRRSRAQAPHILRPNGIMT